MFGGEVLVAEPARLGVGLGEYGEQIAGGLRGRDRGAGDAGQGGQQPLRTGPHLGLVGIGGGEQVGDVLVVLAGEEGQQQVRGVRSAWPSLTALLVAAFSASRLLLVSSASTASSPLPEG